MTSLRNYSPSHPAVLADAAPDFFEEHIKIIPVTIPKPVTPASIPDEVTEESPAEIVEHAIADAGPLPYNAVTGSAYRGGNVMRLLTAEVEHGYGAGGWAGFGQWKTAGRVVRKGEHGTACLTVVTVDTEAGTRTKPRGFKVFHYDQTEELPKEGE